MRVGRISQMTDPSLDAQRHTFDCSPPSAASCRPASCRCTLGPGREAGKDGQTPPVRWIYPVIIGDMSIGALSWRMWEAVAMAVAYLNEECGLPVRMCSGEGGMPVRLLKSKYLKYMILQIASGHFGWNRIIKTMPHMIEDPAGMLIKIGQGAKPGDGGLLMAAEGRRAHPGDPRRAQGRPALAAEPSGPLLHRGERAEDVPLLQRRLQVPRAGGDQGGRLVDLGLGLQQPGARPVQHRRRLLPRRHRRRHRRGPRGLPRPHRPSDRHQAARLLPGGGGPGTSGADPALGGRRPRARPATWRPMPSR